MCMKLQEKLHLKQGLPAWVRVRVNHSALHTVATKYTCNAEHILLFQIEFVCILIKIAHPFLSLESWAGCYLHMPPGFVFCVTTYYVYVADSTGRTSSSSDIHICATSRHVTSHAVTTVNNDTLCDTIQSGSSRPPGLSQWQPGASLPHCGSGECHRVSDKRRG